MTKQGYTVMNCLHRYIYINHMSTGRIVCYTHGLHGLTKTNPKNRTYAVRLLRQTTQCCSTRMFHKCCPHARKSLHSLLTGNSWLAPNLTATSPNADRVPGCQCPTQTGFQAANAQHRLSSRLPITQALQPIRMSQLNIPHEKPVVWSPWFLTKSWSTAT